MTRPDRSGSGGRAITKPGYLLAVVMVLVLGWRGADAREFRAADTQSTDYPTVEAVRYLGELIQKQTNGRLSIKLFHSRQLGEEKETIEQTRVGAIDLNRVNIGPLTGTVPETTVLALPFLFRSPDHLHAVLDGPIGQEILESFSDYGFVGLCFYDSGARSFYNNQRPLRRMADLKGLRVRVQQSDLMIAMVEALGAVPVPLPYGQVLTALATGLIDGAENNWPSYHETGHYQYARYYSLTAHTMSPEVLIMSRKAWDGLDAADRVLFRKAAQESALFMRQRWKDRETQAEDAVRHGGAEIVTDIDRAPFEAAMNPVYDRFIREERLRRLMERIRALP